MKKQLTEDIANSLTEDQVEALMQLAREAKDEIKNGHGMSMVEILMKLREKRVDKQD